MNNFAAGRVAVTLSPTAVRISRPSRIRLLDALKNGVRGDAKLFCKLFGGKLVYDHSAGEWYRFDGHYWRKDLVQQVLHDVDQIALQYELFVTLIINRVREAAAENNKEEQRKQQTLEKEIRARIKALKGESWTRDVLLFAGSGEHDWSLSTTGLEWDKDPFALAVQNGIIDLSDGSLRKGTPADFIRVVAPTEWLGLEEPCPMWRSGT